jgi:hypothetical protein
MPPATLYRESAWQSIIKSKAPALFSRRPEPCNHDFQNEPNFRAPLVLKRYLESITYMFAAAGFRLLDEPNSPDASTGIVES